MSVTFFSIDVLPWQADLSEGLVGVGENPQGGLDAGGVGQQVEQEQKILAEFFVEILEESLRRKF